MNPDTAVFASGNGSNFVALAKAFPGRIGLLICNQPQAGVVGHAHSFGIPSQVLDHAAYCTRHNHEQAVLDCLAKTFGPKDLRLVCLAGYMRILSPWFIEQFHTNFAAARMINLHPARPQDYRGAHSYEHAVVHRFNQWGLTVHEVTNGLDEGPIVASSEHAVYPWEDAAALRQRLRPFEHALFVAAVRKEVP
jgi:phosphoribosylglycinamide formyltransferase-1